VAILSGSYYRLLDLQPEASSAVIEKALLRYETAVGAVSGKRDIASMVTDEARRILTDADLRNTYDRHLKAVQRNTAQTTDWATPWPYTLALDHAWLAPMINEKICDWCGDFPARLATIPGPPQGLIVPGQTLGQPNRPSTVVQLCRPCGIQAVTSKLKLAMIVWLALGLITGIFAVYVSPGPLVLASIVMTIIVIGLTVALVKFLTLAGPTNH
jgi:hypothetical protein